MLRFQPMPSLACTGFFWLSINDLSRGGEEFLKYSASVEGIGTFTFPGGIHNHEIVVTDVNGPTTVDEVIIYVHDLHALEIVFCPSNLIVQSYREIIPVLLTPEMTWPAGNYTVSYEAVDMCDSTAVFNFEVIIAEEDADYCNTGGLARRSQFR